MNENAGSTHWSADTRTVHQLTFTVPDDAIASISEGDDVTIFLQGREGGVSTRLSHNQVSRLLFGDPRNRFRKD